MNLFTKKLHKCMESLALDYKIETRIKSPQRIREKMDAKGFVNDYVGGRVIYDGNRHDAYIISKNIVDEFDIFYMRDYILRPKKNNYQSIHLIGEFLDFPMEIQIRNKEMDYIAKKGSAKIR